MPLSFLNSLFLIGLTSAAIPVIIHLLFKRQKKRVVFSSLRFLQKVTEEKAKRMRIREWLLLAIRVLIFVLVTLAFARPFLHGGKRESAARTDLVLLLDDSYSMSITDGETDRFRDAKLRILDRLSQLREGDRASLVTATAGGVVRQVLTQDLELVAAAVKGSRVTRRFCRYWPAIKRAHSVLAASDGERKRLVFVTDAQLASWEGMSQVQSLEGVGETLSLETVLVGKPAPTNVALLDVKIPARIWSTDVPLKVAAKVANYGSSPVLGLKVKLTWGYQPDTPSDAQQMRLDRVVEKRLGLDPSEVVTLPLVVEVAEKRDVVGKIEIEVDDALRLDNSLFFSISAEDAIRVLCVEDWRAPKPFLQASYYLQRALEPLPRGNAGRAGYVRTEVITKELLQGTDLKSYHVAVLANVAELSPLASDRLEAFVRSGGGLVVFVGDQVDPEFYNRHGPGKGTGWMPAELQVTAGDESRRELFWTLVPVDRQHDLFVPYRGDTWSELSSARFYRYLKAVPAEGAKVLAVYDNDDPAILELQVGEGRVFLFTSTCSAEWTDLPKRGTYLPLVHQLVRYVSPRERESRSVLRLGEPFSAAFGGARSFEELKLLSARGPDGAAIAATDPAPGPGLYHVFSGDREHVLRTVAVNLNTRESNPARVDPGEIAALTMAAEKTQGTIEPDRLSQRKQEGRASKWWRYLLIAAAALMFLELLIANEWVGRR